jgi:hypothetical protein
MQIYRLAVGGSPTKRASFQRGTMLEFELQGVVRNATMRSYLLIVLILLVLSVPVSLQAISIRFDDWAALQPAAAQVNVLDFESLSDGTLVTDQFTGILFSNAIALVAGISLNEFEFPPHSGSVVVSDNGGPMSIVFSNPVFNFGGYFTYMTRLTVTALDALNSQVSSTTSTFSNNEALSGDPNSAPNEFLQVSSPGGISKVTITGSPLGGSFTLDDATFTSTPEPQSILYVLTGCVALCGLRFFVKSYVFKQRSSSRSWKFFEG